MKRDTTFAFEIHHHENTAYGSDYTSVEKVEIPTMIATIRNCDHDSEKSQWLAIQDFFRRGFTSCQENSQEINAFSEEVEYYHTNSLFFPIYHNNGKEFLKLSSLRKSNSVKGELENMKEVGGYVLLEDVMKCFSVLDVVVNEDSGDASKKY